MARRLSAPLCQDTGTISFYITTPVGFDQLELEELCREEDVAVIDLLQPLDVFRGDRQMEHEPTVGGLAVRAGVVRAARCDDDPVLLGQHVPLDEVRRRLAHERVAIEWRAQ